MQHMFYKKNSMGDNVVDEKKLKDFASNLRNLVRRGTVESCRAWVTALEGGHEQGWSHLVGRVCTRVCDLETLHRGAGDARVLQQRNVNANGITGASFITRRQAARLPRLPGLVVWVLVQCFDCNLYHLNCA